MKGVIPTDPHIDTSIEICVMMNIILPMLEYAREVWEGNAKLEKHHETVQIAGAKKILGCTSTTSSTGLWTELEMCPLKTDKTRDKDQIAT